MRVVVISKTVIQSTEYSNVSKIEKTGTNYVITAGGTPYTYAVADYNVYILY